MKDMMLWFGWYAMLLTMPLMAAGLLLKEWVAGFAPAWSRARR